MSTIVSSVLLIVFGLVMLLCILAAAAEASEAWWREVPKAEMRIGAERQVTHEA